MSFAMLVLAIAITNLSLGFVVGTALWGNVSMDNLKRRRSVVTEEPVETVSRGYQSELDLQRLIDHASQRDRKLRNYQSSITDPFQLAWAKAQVAGERAETSLDVGESRLMAAVISVPVAGWGPFFETLQGDSLRTFKTFEESFQGLFESLPAREKHRLSALRTRVQEAIDGVIGTIEKWEMPAEGEVQAAETFLRELREVSDPYRRELRQLHLTLLDTLSENYPADSWELELLRHPGNGMQTLVALQAHRHEEDGASETFVAMLSPDFSDAWLQEYGRLLARVAGDRLMENLGANLPAHWMVVAIGDGRFVVRGEVSQRDEFIAELERLRQRSAAAELRIGETKVQLTWTTGVRPDDVKVPTSILLEELGQRIKAASAVAPGRLVLCDSEADVPVAPLECHVEPLALAF